MKKTVFILSAFVAFALLLPSCKKDDIKTFKDQLVGHWESTSVKSGTTDNTSSTKFKLHLDTSKEFDMDVVSTVPLAGTTTTSYSGEWYEDDSKKDLTLKYDSDGSLTTWDVTDVTDATLTTEHIEKGIRYVIKFEKK